LFGFLWQRDIKYTLNAFYVQDIKFALQTFYKKCLLWNIRKMKILDN